MATKPQAQAAVTSAATAINNDITNILPIGVNIVDGKLDFNPTKWIIRLLATDKSVAEAWTTTMSAALGAAGRQFVVRREGRYQDNEREEQIMISTALAIYVINF